MTIQLERVEKLLEKLLKKQQNRYEFLTPHKDKSKMKLDISKLEGNFGYADSFVGSVRSSNDGMGSIKKSPIISSK